MFSYGCIIVNVPCSSKIERPTGYVVPSSLPIEESEDSDSDGASDDGSLSEAFAYASNAGLVQMQPHPVLVPVQPSVASVGDTQQAYLHTDPNNANSRHRWTPEMVGSFCSSMFSLSLSCSG